MNFLTKTKLTLLAVLVVIVSQNFDISAAGKEGFAPRSSASARSTGSSIFDTHPFFNPSNPTSFEVGKELLNAIRKQQMIKWAGSDSRKLALLPWFDAAVDGDCKTIKELFDKVDINAADPKGMTALHWACEMNHLPVVVILLTKPDINVNALNEDGDSALMRAVFSKANDIVALLLKAPKIDVNIVCTCSGKDTALNMAASIGNVTAVKLLLSRPEIRLDQRNRSNLTAYQIALIKNFTEIAQLIAQKAKDRGTYDAEKSALDIDILTMCKSIVADKKSGNLETASASKHCAKCDKPNCTKWCGKCQIVYYCSVACQKEHWNMHKGTCKPAGS